MLEIILICWKLMIESYYRKIWRFRAIGKTLSPEDQLIVKESKAHKEKSTETRNENTDKKCVLANQLVDKYGRDTSKYRKAHKKDHILVSSCAWTSVTTNFGHLRLLWAAKRKFEISTIHSPNHAFLPPHQCTLCISKHSRMATYGGAGVEIR